MITPARTPGCGLGLRVSYCLFYTSKLALCCILSDLAEQEETDILLDLCARRELNSLSLVRLAVLDCNHPCMRVPAPTRD